MEITTASLTSAKRGLQKIFDAAYTAGIVDPWWKVLAMLTNSTGADEEYHWLSAIPGLKELLGEITIRNLARHAWIIRNREWESTFGIKLVDLERDKLGVYTPFLTAAAESAALHPGELIAELLVNGFDDEDYTGKKFFDTNKKAHAKATAFSNIGVKKLSSANFRTARANLTGRLNAAGKAMRLGVNLQLVVSPTWQATALEITKAERLANGQDNVDRGTATTMVVPELLALGAEDAWFLIETGKSVMDIDVEEIRTADKGKPIESRRIIEGAAHTELVEKGHLVKGPNEIFDVRTPREKGKAGAFAWDPADLRISLEDLKGRYDPPVWDAFEKWARAQEIPGQGRTVWEWLTSDVVEKPAPGTWPTLAQLTEVRTLGGSTGAKLMKTADGTQYVVKAGNSPAHIREEHLADQLYTALGIPVPRAQLEETAAGPVKIAEHIDGRTLAEFLRTTRGAAREKVLATLRDNFVADALLANYDVIGLENDNILIDADGTPWRIDNGGSLRFRAQGNAIRDMLFKAGRTIPGDNAGGSGAPGDEGDPLGESRPQVPG